MSIRQITKKRHVKKKPNRKEEGHWEGKYWCNCRTRNYRKWLGVKKYGRMEKFHYDIMSTKETYGK